MRFVAYEIKLTVSKQWNRFRLRVNFIISDVNSYYSVRENFYFSDNKSFFFSMRIRLSCKFKYYELVRCFLREMLSLVTVSE